LRKELRRKTVLAKAAILCTVVAGLVVLEPTVLLARRRPLPRPKLEEVVRELRSRLPQHTEGGAEIGIRTDPKSGELVQYSYDSAITYDARLGNFLFIWTGIDGRRKTYTYEPRSKVDGVISAAVDYDTRTRLLRYAYTVRSLPSSQQKLRSLSVETRAPVEDVKLPDSSWFSHSFSRNMKKYLEAQAGWGWVQSGNRRNGLLPGEQANGFSYLSAGLPTVVKCFIDGRTEERELGEGLPGALDIAKLEAQWRIPQGVTVGPDNPPRPFSAAAFARQLAQYVSTSLDNGWIESTQVGQQLRSALAELQGAIEKGEKPRAVKILSELSARVEREKGKALLSEAYALLKFNLEFLRDKLAVK